MLTILFSFGQTDENAEYTAGKTKRICYKGPLSVNEKPSADQDEYVNNFTKFKVPI